MWSAACPGRCAAFFMPLRTAGTVTKASCRYGPGSAAHRSAKGYALRCVRGTIHIVAPSTHGANSALPKSKLSLLVGAPEAVLSIRSKMR